MESKSFWQRWVRAANPFASAKTEAEALRAARTGAVATALMAILAVIGIVVSLAGWAGTIPNTQNFLAKTYVTSGVDPSAANAMAHNVASSLIMAAVVWDGIFAVGYLVLAIVLWRKPIRSIYAVLLILTGLALLMLVYARLAPLPVPRLPTWRFAYNVAFDAAEIWLLIAGLSGAGKLARFRARSVNA